MPANKKYLSSPFQRLLKISAGFVGGYTVMLSFHLLLSMIFERNNIIITAAFTGYILWAILLLVAFLSSNGWKIWLCYIVLTLAFALPYILKS